MEAKQKDRRCSPSLPKTARQVRRYLRRQPWYDSFRRLVWMEENRSIRDRIRTLRGRDGGYTIIGAFDWTSSVQGFNGWSEVSNEFDKWYFNE